MANVRWLLLRERREEAFDYHVSLRASEGRVPRRSHRRVPEKQKTQSERGFLEMELGGLEPPTS